MVSRRLYRSYRDAQSQSEQDRKPRCVIAADFSTFLEALIFSPLTQNPSRAKIAQGKYMLSEEWHAWRKSLPEKHRFQRAENHHRCLDEVYFAAYDRLHLLDLTTRPTRNVIADYDVVVNRPIAGPPSFQSPSPPVPPQEPSDIYVNGILLGETDE